MENEYKIGECIICKQIKTLKNDKCIGCNAILPFVQDNDFSNSIFGDIFKNLKEE